jgi:hypothetical protein
MSKFLLNLRLQISKALVNSKIQFLIQKFFFFLISARPTPRPAWPLAQPAHRPRHPRRPKSPGRPIQPACRSRLHRKYAFLFGSCLPEPAAPPRFSDIWAPAVSFVPHLQPPSSPAPPPIPGHRAPLRSAPRVLSDHYHLAFISPPLIPLLNLSSSRPSSMSLKTLTPALTARPPLRSASSNPIKGEQSLRASPHLSPLSFPSLRALASLSPSADTTEPSPLSPVLVDAARDPVRP